jgi:valyl-tRNA synthetase
MSELAKKTLKTVKSGKTKIIPKNFEKVLLSWLENIKDWCISRQIWWGHQIPVWFCENQTGISNSQFPISNENLKFKIKNSSADNFIISVEQPKRCSFCKNCSMRQSADVLDTWFSSALWPFAGLSEKDLKDFHPSNVLITARDIINLWVARMIFSGLELMGKTPFPEVLIHATILTKEGKRMSKSLGTGIDPLELIEKYGADATRFGIIWQAMGTQDIHWDEAAVMAGKKFANKIWNIARYIAGRSTNNESVTNKRINGFAIRKFEKNSLFDDSADKEILKKLKVLKKQVEKDIKNYEFGPALHKAYDFVWHEFADKYIEVSKKREDENVKMVLRQVLMDSLKILHPFMPFVTEEIYQKLSLGNALIVAEW